MVGLDIGADSIKVAEARYGKDGISVTALGIARTPEGVIENEVIVDPKALANALKALLAESGIKTKQVTSSVAGQSHVVIRVIEVPKMAKEELAETMKWEVERQVPFPPNEVVMDYQPLEKPNADPNAQNMEVLLAVAQEELINSHVETLRAAGLKPVAIDIEPLAAGRALLSGNGGAPKDEIVAIVNIGAGDTDLGIFEQGLLTFPSPPLSIAGISFTREIAEALGQTLDQAETTKKEYASVKLGGFAQAPPAADPVADSAPASADANEPTSFDTSFGPGVQSASAFDFGAPAPVEPEARGIAAEPAKLSDFKDTVDGPVFDSPDLSFAGPVPESAPEAVPASSLHPEPVEGHPEPVEGGGPSFDLGNDDQTIGAPAFDLGGDQAPAFDLGAEQTPAAPAAALHPEPVEGGPSFDLDDEPAAAQPVHEEPDAPSFDPSEASQHSDPGEPAQVMPVAASIRGTGSIEDRVFDAISGVLVDLANELRRSMEYYSTRYSRMPERIYLCGGMAKMPHLDEFLSSELGIPVEVADPIKKLQVKAPGVSDRYLHEIAPMFSVAIGLAIRDMVQT